MNDQLLIIDNNLEDHKLYLRLLNSERRMFSDIHHSRSLDETLEYLTQNTPLCCIVDANFQGGSAKELIKTLGKRFTESSFPIVVSTAQRDERLAVDLMQMGAQDYLVKGSLNALVLIRAIKNAIKTHALQTQLHKMAHYDSLTGLLNRTLFMNRLEQAVNEAKRYDRSLCLISLDIDHFKQINDTYGHDAGDIILQSVASRIKECVRHSDSVARLGGDEFIVLLPCAASHDGHFVAQKILKVLPAPIQLEQTSLNVYPSIGLANFPDTAQDHHELLKQVDAALYKAKKQGRSQYVKFSATYQSEWQRKNTLSQAIPLALKSKTGLRLAFQPQFKVNSGQCIGVEALVRWNYENEDISTAHIIELVNQSSMAIPYHEWLFEESIKQLKAWQETLHDLNLSINLPANLCHNRTIIEGLFNTINKYDISPSCIILEITETHLMRHPEPTKQMLIGLAQQGVRIAIDDFGTGHSSLEYLAHLPCSQLKIDQRFFLHWNENEKNQKIVEAITALGHQLGLDIIAEGIESEHLLEVVRKMGCDAAQGYWLGKPRFGDQPWQDFLTSSKPTLDVVDLA